VGRCYDGLGFRLQGARGLSLSKAGYLELPMRSPSTRMTRTCISRVLVTIGDNIVPEGSGDFQHYTAKESEVFRNTYLNGTRSP
jgi:hypothetical protein